MKHNKTRYIIYCITNKITQRKYIGKTHYGLITRWNRHIRDAYKPNPNCTYIARSIVKYGADNFDIVEIDSAKDPESLIELETKYILEFNTLSPNGYNLKVKDRGTIIYSEETIERFRQNFYKNHYEYTKSKEYSELQRRLQQGKTTNPDNPTSKYIGVCKHRNIWMSRLSNVNLGRFDSEQDAAIRYDIEVFKQFGEDGIYNFPENIEYYKNNPQIPKKNIKPKEGKYLLVTRFRTKTMDGWMGVVFIGKNKRKTKVFTFKKYEDPELSAHLWRLSTLENLNIDNKP